MSMDEDIESLSSETDVDSDKPVVVNKFYGTKAVVNIKDSKNIKVNISEEQSGHARKNFSSLCGKNIQLCNDNTQAKRNEITFSGGLCFVSEELTPEKPVYLKITETYCTKHGDCTMGFTTTDPSNLLTARILESMISKAVPQGYKDWFMFKPPLASCSYTRADVFFWRTEEGTVVFKNSRGIEESYDLGIDPRKPMWAFVELSGPLEAVEMIRPELHTVCGTGVSINKDVVEHNSTLLGQFTSRSHGFVCFSKMPLKTGDRFYFKVLRVCSAWAGNVRVGVTNVSPNVISSSRLPETVTNEQNYRMVELSLQNASCDNTISVFHDNNRVTLFDKTELTGIIQVNRSETLWVVVDLFGNTTGVELVSKCLEAVESEKLDTGNDGYLEWSSDIKSIHNWWMKCEVLVNTLKQLANAISAQTLRTTEGTWNYLVRATTDAACYATNFIGIQDSVTESLQVLESGSYPELIRSECPTIVEKVQSFIEETKILKQTLISHLPPEEGGASSEDSLTDLRQFLQNIPEFELHGPKRGPVPPSPSPSLLDLSMLPVDAVDENAYITERVAKTFEKTAQRIEHPLLKLEKCRFKLYTSLVNTFISDNTQS